MAGATDHIALLQKWRAGLSKDDRWCILINADPDALASALALKRIMIHKVHNVDIARINEVTRPDNLAMIRYLNIPVRPWQPENADQYTHLAMVDSQPHHSKAFQGLHFDCVIDHHPLPRAANNVTACSLAGPALLRDIRPNMGATSTMMARYLKALRMRPGPRLATALLYGIRTDTAAFERSGGEDDFRAYQWLSRHADNGLLRRILRSEYLREWLPLFSRAFRSLADCRGGGAFASLNEVNSADLLVAVADFFTRVHGLRWIAVSGVVDKTVIVIFRGDGGRDIGRLADACFYDVGEAGGHRNLARAEFPLSAVPEGVKPGDFVLKRIETRKLRRKTTTPDAPSDPAERGAA
ncbi:DHH family phosphoesterase [Desulfovibrio desulfuricans]|uniref:DHH family phosphoesterase n=1 Tax=Desulfovibrio desulfuricans TaxID=876 RepID=UPI0003B40922|nr:DHH family phosphoesterase [Desulfovibrio desulfuricans]QTO40682.1 DHH family phosphoesterase [Desulfovibrio desulfuricans]